MPSLEEGFGLPVVEAAACGIPVICSDVSSLPEVLEEPAACFDPLDPRAIARAIEHALRDGEHRVDLLAAGARAAQRWTWSRVARDTVDSLSTLGPRWRRPIRSPRRRLAIAGPVTGSASAIGPYDDCVIEAIQRQPGAPEMIVFVDGSGSSEPAAAPDMATLRWPVRSLGRFHKPWDVDDIVAVLGSSPSHVATAELARRTPCHVWLHEASLVGVHLGLAHASGSEGWGREHVQEFVDANETPEMIQRLSTVDILDAPLLDELGATLLAGTIHRARSVIVSSDRAADTVRRLRPDGPPLLVLPLAFPTVEDGPREPPTQREIVVAGWLASNKAPHVAVEVLARLTAEHDAHLTFVGPTVDDAVDEVAATAARLGVADRVTVTGPLDEHDYRRRLLGARVGLQLRLGDRGEMSAAVTDLVAHGVPTVTTLSTAGPSTPGLQVVELDTDALVGTIRPLLADDGAWTVASADARARAQRWTFDGVAHAVLGWLDEVDDLPPGTVRRHPALLASPPSDG